MLLKNEATFTKIVFALCYERISTLVSASSCVSRAKSYGWHRLIFLHSDVPRHTRIRNFRQPHSLQQTLIKTEMQAKKRVRQKPKSIPIKVIQSLRPQNTAASLVEASDRTMAVKRSFGLRGEKYISIRCSQSPKYHLS